MNKDGHVYLPKSAVEAYFVQHPDIKAKLKGTDANEAVAARETFLTFLALHGAVNAPSAKAKPQVVCTWCSNRVLHAGRLQYAPPTDSLSFAYHFTSILARLVVGVDEGVYPVDRLRVSALPDPEVLLDDAKHAPQVLRPEELVVVVEAVCAEVLDPGWHRALAWLR
ncbi:hypothetical protein T492DRAFT_843449 [Pavlovales sp. CCMP2436]|nr:hypothetical protein T492DRAFT_843449 [Pavlovales sp. CCMP2436]